MKVLVTGATGFLGSHLVKRLQTMDLEVYGTGRNAKAGAELIQSGVKFIPMELGDPYDFKALPPKIDWIVHSAALSSPWGRPEVFYRSNVLATEQMLNYARRAVCQRFVHISSPSIYVDRRDRLNVSEDEPLPDLSLNHYISTKKQAEQKVDAASAKGLSTITLRPQGIVGQGDRAIFPRIMKIAQKGMIPRIGQGETRTDLTHVENVVDAIVAALQAPSQLSGRKYNITNGDPVEIYSVIESLMKNLGVSFKWKPLSLRKAYNIGAMLEWTSRNLLGYREPLLTRYTACALGASRTLNISRAQSELKYQPRVSIEQALHEVCSDLKDQ